MATLTDKVDKLTFEIRLKNKDIENLKEQVQTTKTQNVGLRWVVIPFKKIFTLGRFPNAFACREEIKKYRDEADEAKSTCGNLQEKIRYLQRQNKEVEDVKRDCEKLRALNERLKG